MSDTLVPVTTKKDWTSDQEVRWCPGCGDYGILLAVQQLMPDLGITPENTVFISGIGCSSRFPYYMNTYGMHSIHGRAPAIATGLKSVRPDLQVWVITGDGDALSIGGNHFLHCIRRNVNLKVVLFNNRIYGLTKGQYSPTSELGKVTKSTPSGSADSPFNPISLALGAEASFVARTIDSDRKHLQAVLRSAANHQGSAFVEIYQNCNIFNDGAFDLLKEPDTRDAALIRLEHGQPITFGTSGEFCVVHPPGAFGLEVKPTAEVDPTEIVVHDEAVAEPAYAFALSRLPALDLSHTPIGVFRRVARPTYDGLVRSQVETATAKVTEPELELAGLLNSGDTWTIV
jgi:2-oxoglutarate/2-oxoacid ferredoxin oxidoreductase subunit beta